MGIERPDDADVSSDQHADQPAGHTDVPDDGGAPPDRTDPIPAETRDRYECYADLRVAVEVEERPGTWDRAKSEEQAGTGEGAKAGKQVRTVDGWDESAERYRGMWAEYLRKWPPEERTPVDRSSDPPGSWRGDRNQFLGVEDNSELEKQCDGIAELEQEKISPKMREVERCDPGRHLIGFEHRLKGRDRIKEKIYDDITLLSHSPREAISALPDAIRYTFEYDETRYTQGVRADIVRMKEQGFELAKLRNFWSDDQYKGINSQWIEPESGQRFELQFHTKISFEAKQITHRAYEQLRTKQAGKFETEDEFEAMVLEAFQTKVSSAIPIPAGATDIPDYPEKERHARQGHLLRYR